MDSNFKHDAPEKLLDEKDKQWHQKAVGHTWYIHHLCRHDIVLVEVLSFYMSCPGTVHKEAMIRLLGYLNATQEYGLEFDFSEIGNPDLEVKFQPIFLCRFNES
ncbi:hypothetical protein TRICI_002796 [Trichomonascus ciferrii]|uniref:Reverse transcriptase Ty1/copia-type domain-containing protein n=1 Tax=Trichomonascus ciferrii TaxID=44093 RepID=A0A642V510_9ASCO|nr:hypothetical protein TRICI_002796 [Trichomonascus ciferrii]